MNEQQDPKGLEASQPGAKLDSGKPDASLLLHFGKALSAVAEVGTAGAKKYSRGGWQEVDDGVNRYTAAMLRHLLAENYETFDKDISAYLGKDVRHAASVAWNALARLELILRQDVDDEKCQGDSIPNSGDATSLDNLSLNWGLIKD